MLQSLSLPCGVVDVERVLFVFLETRGTDYASQRSIYNPPPGHPVQTLASQPAAPWDPLPLPGRCLSYAISNGQVEFTERIFSNICIYMINTCFLYRCLQKSIHHAQIQSSLLCILYDSICLLPFVRPSCTFLALLRSSQAL